MWSFLFCGLPNLFAGKWAKRFSRNISANLIFRVIIFLCERIGTAKLRQHMTHIQFYHYPILNGIFRIKLAQFSEISFAAHIFPSLSYIVGLFFSGNMLKIGNSHSQHNYLQSIKTSCRESTFYTTNRKPMIKSLFLELMRTSRTSHTLFQLGAPQRKSLNWIKTELAILALMYPSSGVRGIADASKYRNSSHERGSNHNWWHYYSVIDILFRSLFVASNFDYYLPHKWRVCSN